MPYQRRLTISTSTPTAPEPATATWTADGCGWTTVGQIGASQDGSCSYHATQVTSTACPTPDGPKGYLEEIWNRNDSLLKVPRSRSSIHLRAFSTAAVVWWNTLTTNVDVRRFSTQQMKVATHRWLHLHPPWYVFPYVYAKYKEVINSTHRGSKVLKLLAHQNGQL